MDRIERTHVCGQQRTCRVEHAVVYPDKVKSREDRSTSREPLVAFEHEGSENFGARERARHE